MKSLNLLLMINLSILTTHFVYADDSTRFAVDAKKLQDFYRGYLITEKPNPVENSGILYPGDKGYLGDGVNTNQYGKPLYGGISKEDNHPKGDYSRLEFRIRTEKEIYAVNEKIEIQLYVGNASDSVAHVQLHPGANSFRYYGANFILVKNSSGDPVLPTDKGQREIIHDVSDGKITGYDFVGYGSASTRVALDPKMSLQISLPCPINKYFQMDKPDTYEITFYRKSFFYPQLYAQPVPSNTLKIKITDSPKQTIDVKKGKQTLNFNIDTSLKTEEKTVPRRNQRREEQLEKDQELGNNG
ncbi:MAG: hypothetical protein LBJ67_00260 [Planctomycetaceae bacterium]|jgi:hypothetical protein|nr:hypothetical protein [Planctomycetaceae bacterium]